MKALHITGWTLALVLIVGTLLIAGNMSIEFYIDGASALFVAGLALACGIAAHGTGFFRAYGVSVRGGDGRELETALAVFRMTAKVLAVSGSIAVLIGVIAMLGNIGDASAFARGLGVTLIGPLYAGILYLLGVLPFASMTERKIGRTD